MQTSPSQTLTVLKNTAFLFPGQGSQSIGMMESFLNEPSIQETLKHASDVCNVNIINLITQGPSEVLNQTANTQVVVAACSVAIYQCLQKYLPCMPEVMAGHSLGESSALIAAKAFTLDDGIAWVHKRASITSIVASQSKGAMAAILGLDDAKILEICQTISESTGLIIEAVNFNTEGQVVISGHIDALEQACIALKDAGAKRAIKLAVSGAFHSSLMLPASYELNDYLNNKNVNLPSVPVLHNVNAEYSQNTCAIKAALIKQLYKPVLWRQSMQTLKTQGIKSFIEFGSGKVLVGMLKKDTSIEVMAIDHLEALLAFIEKQKNNHLNND